MSQKSKDIAIAIPARLNSRRLKNKVLMKFNGLEMIEHVRRRALLNRYDVPVFVISGDNQILELINNFGGLCHKTKLHHANGLSRVAEAMSTLNFSNFVVVQADEVLIDPESINILISNVKKNKFDAVNCVTKIKNIQEIKNLNVVKCILDEEKNILNIFRKSPLISELNIQLNELMKITGLFAFKKFSPTYKKNEFETLLIKKESIEQLFFLKKSFQFKSLEIKQNWPSVNTKKDYLLCKKILQKNKFQQKILRAIDG